jgi:PPOX class probable F420-dependent enzyme
MQMKHSGLKMTAATMKRLGKERFVSLRTYRENGEAVDTPVWIVQDGEELLVFTPRKSGKVGRIEANKRVQLAPSGRFGEVQGRWVNAEARIDNTEQLLNHAYVLLGEKLGPEFAAYKLFLGKDWRDRRSVVRITALE